MTQAMAFTKKCAAVSLAILSSLASTSAYEGVIATSSTSTFSLYGTGLQMEVNTPNGNVEYYRVTLFPSDFAIIDGTVATNANRSWVQTACVQGTSFANPCDSTNVEKMVTFARPVLPTGTATLSYILRVVDTTTTQILPDGSSIETPSNSLKIDIVVRFPEGSSATDTLRTGFYATYQVPTTLQEVLDANVKVANIQAFEDAATFTKDANGCATQINVNAIFDLSVNFATSYDANGAAAVVCASASNNLDAEKLDIMLDWHDIGQTGGDVVLTLDPSFKIDNGSLSGGFNFFWLMVVVGVATLTIITGCVWYCCKCCKCCCYKEQFKYF
eukprot:m.448687 g.448687  ORF g.448687 m.448687 type:complete len:330 (-) comp19695_c0_seq1:81-1070(-)